ncbi:MAG: ribosome recycling factor [bacterium]
MLDEVYKETEQRMQKSLEATEKEFSRIRTGRPSPTLLENLPVDVYDSKMPINQLASIAIQQPRTLVVRPFDRTNVGAIDKAIRTSDLGLNPHNDGKNIMVEIPPLSEERRKELVKVVRKKAEEGKVAIRNIRRDARDEVELMEKEKEISEDDMKKGHDRIQELTDEYTEKTDGSLKRKEEEIINF